MSGLLPDLASEILGAYAQPAARLALPYIMHGVSAGLSANNILGTLREAGLGIRRQTALKLVSALRTNYGYPSYLKSGGQVGYPHPELFRMAAYPTRRRYTYIVKVTGRSTITGESGYQWISISSDTALDVQEWQDQAIAVMESGAMNYALNPEQYFLDHILTSPTLGPE